MLAFITSLLLLAPAPPIRSEVALLRSRLAPLAALTPGSDPQPLGPMSPRGFGLEEGRLRFLAASSAASAVIVEVAGRQGGALFALPIAGGPPIRLAATRGIGLDVALSPDGRRLFYVEGTTPMVATLTGGAAPVAIEPPTGVSATAPEVRIDRPRWLDDRTIAYERETSHAGGHLTTTVESAPADGSARASLLIPRSPTQDRLAAVVGDTVLAYRDGTLFVFDTGLRAPRPAHPIGGRFTAGVVAPWPNQLGRLEHAVIALGGSGTARKNTLARLDPGGAMTPLTHERMTYLDPLVTPDQRAVLWSVETPRGWVVERVALDGTTQRTVTPAHAAPIQLVAFSSDGARVVGCRGPEIVAFDPSGAGALAVLDSAPENPSCTVRAAVGGYAIYEKTSGTAWQVALAPLDGHGAIRTVPRSSWVGVLGDRVILQRGWEGSAAIARETPAPPVPLVPWSADEIAQAARTPDGATVVFRLGHESRWRAVRLDHPGVIVDVTGPADGQLATGLADDRLAGWEPTRNRLVSWRLDGQDAGRPLPLLEGIIIPGPYVPTLGLVFGMRPDGAVASAAIDGRVRSTVLRAGATPWPRLLAYDPVHQRAVTQALVGGRVTIVAAGLLGEDLDHPRILGVPRPALDSELDRIEVTKTGDVLLEYATSMTAMPHPSGSDLLAADGSGFITPTTPPERLPPSFRDLILPALPPADDYGAETRTPL